MTEEIGSARLARRVMNGYEGHWFVVGSALWFGFLQPRVGQIKEIQIMVMVEEADEQVHLLLKNFKKENLEIESFSCSRDHFVLEACITDIRISVSSLCDSSERYELSELYARSLTLDQVSCDFVVLQGVVFPAPFSRAEFFASLQSQSLIRRLAFKARAHAVFWGWAFGKTGSRVSRFASLSNGLRQRIAVQLFEFPRVSARRLARFDSFDRQLGWDNQPNTVKLDKTDRSLTSVNFGKKPPIFFSIDSRGSRISKYGYSPAEISVYGDSYAMCRDVGDQDTISWNLASIRGSNCTNYGVGNYGLDQSLLKLLRNYSLDSTPIVILAATSITMARCVSVYRHYLEPGNVLAVKPRFIVRGNQELELVEAPISRVEDLKSLRKKKEVIRKFDEHYSYWKSRRSQVVSRAFGELGQRVAKPSGMQGSEHFFAYESSFWTSHEPLFLEILGQFATFSKTHRFKPIFLLQHQERSLQYLRGVNKDLLPWTNAISLAKEMNPTVRFLDEGDLFQEFENIDMLFVRSHHSPLANRLVAEYIHSCI